jgi:hypothetical protein
VLKREVTGEMSRAHVNRLRIFSEDMKEGGSAQAGVCPNDRRLFLRLFDENLMTEGDCFN